MRWARTAGVALVVVCLVAAGCGSGQDKEAAESPGRATESVAVGAVGIEPLGDLSEMVVGRRPEVAVGPAAMLAYAGTDYSLDHPDGGFALSTDDGQSFQRLDFDPRLANLGVVVGEDDALVIGNPCDEPLSLDPDASCASGAPTLAAYAIDLASGQSTELTQPPLEGFVSDGVGVVGDRSGVIVRADAGPTLLTWGASGWERSPLPAETTRVCPTGDVLTAVTNGRSLTSTTGGGAVALAIVPPGEPLWAAQVSTDGGRSWGAAVPFPAGETRDVGFGHDVLCGPQLVLVHSAQIAVFDPAAPAWTPVELPGDATIGPGVGGTWVDDDTVRMWTQADVGPPVEVGKGRSPLPTTASTIRISGLATGRPTAEPTPSGLPDGVGPTPLRGAGATQAGIVLLVGSSFDLARAS